MTDSFLENAVQTADEQRARKPLIADAPPDLDEALSSISVWPVWVRLLVIGGASIALWAVIIFALRWAVPLAR